jgi:hypothetical protein
MGAAATAFSQQSLPDSQVLQQAMETNKQLYKNTLGASLRLYNGFQYTHPAQRSLDFPFWITDSFVRGTVWYDGNEYNDVPLRYDLFHQTLTTKGFQNQDMITLITEKINSFLLRQHRFILLKAVEDSGHTIQSGFYDRLYEGRNLSLWAKRKKEFELSTKAENGAGSFKESTEYYIRLNGVFYPVNSKRDLVSVLKNKKEAIHAFVKMNRLSFKKNIETTLLQLVIHCDQ